MRISNPVDYYLEFNCCTMIGGGLSIGDEAHMFFTRDMPFRENLPLIMVTPYYIGVPQRMSFDFTRQEYHIAFVGEGIMNGLLTLAFVPNGSI